MDDQVVMEYLDHARQQKDAHNVFAEAFWMGRAVQHVHQNAMDVYWLTCQLEERGLETLVTEAIA